MDKNFLPLCKISAPRSTNVHKAVDYLEQMGVLMLKEDIEAPPFILSDLEGRQVGLREFQGKFIMLNFWATW